MAPEVWKIYGSSQAANDIFSLGVVLYWCLSSYCESFSFVVTEIRFFRSRIERCARTSRDPGRLHCHRGFTMVVRYHSGMRGNLAIKPSSTILQRIQIFQQKRTNLILIDLSSAAHFWFCKHVVFCWLGNQFPLYANEGKYGKIIINVLRNYRSPGLWTIKGERVRSHSAFRLFHPILGFLRCSWPRLNNLWAKTVGI